MTDPLMMPESTEAEIESPSQTVNASAWTGIGPSFEEGFKSSPLGAFWRWNVKEGYKNFDQSPKVPLDQIPKDLQGSFKTSPSQNYLNWMEQANREKVENEQNVADASNGLIGKFGNNVVGLVGNALGFPVPGVGSAIGRASEAGYDALKGMMYESKALRFGLKAGIGSVEGGAVGASMGVGQYIYDNQLGQNANAWDVIGANMFAGMEWGAGIRVIGGSYRLLRKKDDISIKEAAAQQMENDKKTNVGPIFNQGFYETAQGQRDSFDPDVEQSVSDHLQSRIDQTNDAIQAVPEHRAANLFGIEKLNDAISILRKKQTDWTDSEMSRLQDMQDIPYMNDVINAATKNPLDRNEGEKELISNFGESPEFEKDLIKNNIKSNSDEIESLRKVSSDYLKTKKENLEKTSEDRAYLARLNSTEGSKEFFENELERQKFPINVMKGLESRINELQDKADSFDLNRAPGKGSKRLRGLLKDVEDAKNERREFMRLNDEGRIEKARDKLRKEKERVRQKINKVIHGSDDNVPYDSRETTDYKESQDRLLRLKRIKRLLDKAKDDIDSQNKIDSDRKKNILELNKLKLLRDHYQSLKDHQDAVINHLRSEPVDPNDLKSTVNVVRSVDGSSFMNSGSGANIQEDLDETKDLKHYEKVFKEYKRTGKIPEEVVEEIKGEHASLDRGLKSSRTLIGKAINCLLAGGADE